jgi:catechol 2,3-dioxygenase-like lactoylglutathione lyase family enzyme
MEALREHFNEPIELAGSGYVAISTRNLERAVNFYSRLFGFRVIERRRNDHAAHVLLSTRGDAFVAVHEQQAAAAPEPGAARWTFAVPDLDRVRETLWNQGVVPLTDGMTDERSLEPAEPRFLVIRDPDGHEIELVE